MGRAAPGSLFGLAPNGVYHAPSIALGAVGSYPTFSPSPGEPGGLFSVALAVDDILKCHLPRASRPVERVTRHRALRSSDFPPPANRRRPSALPGSENQAKLSFSPRPNKPLGQVGLTLAW